MAKLLSVYIRDARRCGGGVTLADQLTLSQPGSTLCSPHYYVLPTDLQTFLRPCRTVAKGEVWGSFSPSWIVGVQLTLFPQGRGQIMHDTFTACPTGFETLTAALTKLRLPLKTILFHFFNCIIVCFVEYSTYKLQ